MVRLRSDVAPGSPIRAWRAGSGRGSARVLHVAQDGACSGARRARRWPSPCNRSMMECTGGESPPGIGGPRWPHPPARRSMPSSPRARRPARVLHHDSSRRRSPSSGRRPPHPPAIEDVIAGRPVEVADHVGGRFRRRGDRGLRAAAERPFGRRGSGRLPDPRWGHDRGEPLGRRSDARRVGSRVRRGRGHGGVPPGAGVPRSGAGRGLLPPASSGSSAAPGNSASIRDAC